jgi:hypothetical protein
MPDVFGFKIFVLEGRSEKIHLHVLSGCPIIFLRQVFKWLFFDKEVPMLTKRLTYLGCFLLLCSGLMLFASRNQEEMPEPNLQLMEFGELQILPSIDFKTGFSGNCFTICDTVTCECKFCCLVPPGFVCSPVIGPDCNTP